MKARLTPAQFAAALSLARLSADRAAVARAVLVDGRTYAQAVEPFGWTRQAAYGPIKHIEEHWARYQAAREAEAGASDGTEPADRG